MQSECQKKLEGEVVDVSEAFRGIPVESFAGLDSHVNLSSGGI